MQAWKYQIGGWLPALYAARDIWCGQYTTREDNILCTGQT
jgi:hypothetical protein